MSLKTSGMIEILGMWQSWIQFPQVRQNDIENQKNVSYSTLKAKLY